ncbi:hypothetical protein DXG03_005051 [Asterophora parasitica]|uniref:Uncharacterized protein n=1 Tax=Asterophora parasitica TaxID=117018 RepID=A0A9P7GAD5_9AGAR|nr:hypothetical protein DXG03_005051 [Asterophora parasitica]
MIQGERIFEGEEIIRKESVQVGTDLVIQHLGSGSVLTMAEIAERMKETNIMRGIGGHMNRMDLQDARRRHIVVENGEVTPRHVEAVKSEEGQIPSAEPEALAELATNSAPEQPGPSQPSSLTPPLKTEPVPVAIVNPEPTSEPPRKPSPPREPRADRHLPDTKKEPEPELKAVREYNKPRQRSPSQGLSRYSGHPPPPSNPTSIQQCHSPSEVKQPRYPVRPQLPTNPNPVQQPRSPPRGPRNHSGSAHPRGNVTPTGPASSYPPGPRGQRRQYPTSGLPSAPPIEQKLVPIIVMEDPPAPAPEPMEVKTPLPQIPLKKLPLSLTHELDAELSRLQAHRAHLASEYAQLAKGTRRALHELDIATIDLRGVELRRRVADIQYEKARNGVLGVDHVPTTDTSIV